MINELIQHLPKFCYVCNSNILYEKSISQIYKSQYSTCQCDKLSIYSSIIPIHDNYAEPPSITQFQFVKIRINDINFLFEMDNPKQYKVKIIGQNKYSDFATNIVFENKIKCIEYLKDIYSNYIKIKKCIILL